MRHPFWVSHRARRPNTEKLNKKLNDAQLTKIAEAKMADMNADDIESVKRMVAGTARSMGVEVEG